MSWPLGTEYFSLWSEFYTPEDIYHAFSTLSSLHFGLCTQTVHSFLADHLQNLLFSCLIVASHGELLWRYSKQNQAKASNVLHQSYKYFSGPCFPVLSMRMSCEMVLKAYLYLLLLTKLWSLSACQGKKWSLFNMFVLYELMSVPQSFSSRSLEVVWWFFPGFFY